MLLTHNGGGPYVGPRPFDLGQGRYFFGRLREVKELVSLIAAHKELLIYAESAAGKTSLINAALIPALERAGSVVFQPTGRFQGDSLEASIHSNGNIYVRNALSRWVSDPADLGEDMDLVSFLNSQPRKDNRTWVIIFDQFEELVRLYPECWRDRKDFFEQVRAALLEDSNLRFVFVMRQEFVPALDQYTRILPERLSVRYHLERLQESCAREAITAPVAQWQHDTGIACQYDEDVVEEILGDLLRGDEYADPLILQLVCRRVWQEWNKTRPEDGRITREHSKAAGDVANAIEHFYDDVIHQTVAHEANQAHGVTAGDLNLWFADHLITPLETRSSVLRNDREERTAGLPNTLVDFLDKEHLLRSEPRNKAIWYELVHDRFIPHIKDVGEQEQRRRDAERERLAALKKRKQTLMMSLPVIFALVVLLGLLVFQYTPIFAPVLGKLAEDALEAGNFEQSMTFYDLALQRDPDSVVWRSGLSRAYYEGALGVEDPETGYLWLLAANAEATHIVTHDPESADGYHLRGQINLELQDWVRAYDDFTRATELRPSAEAYMHLGDALVGLASRGESKLYAEAEEAYLTAHEYNPDSAEVFVQLGRMLPQMGQDARALDCYRTAVALGADPALIEDQEDALERRFGPDTTDDPVPCIPTESASPVRTFDPEENR